MASASISGGNWELTNSTTLSYVISETNPTTSKVTTTTVAKITGLANLSLVGNDIMVADSSGSKTALVTTGDNPDIDIIDVVPEEETKNDATTVKSYSGKLVLGPRILGTAALTLSNGKYNGGTENVGLKATNLSLGFVDANSAVHILKSDTDSSKHLVYDAKNGKINVVADLSAGYVVNGLKATYSTYAGDAVLATISGLKKNLTDADAYATATLDDKALDVTEDELVDQFDKTGTITLSKDSAGTTDNSVLDTSAISIAQSTVAKNNGITYTLALNENAEKAYAQNNAAGTAVNYGEYAQKPVEYYIKTVADGGVDAAYWTVKGTTATYQVDSPTGYALDSTATKVNVTKAKTTTLATVSGLLNNVEAADDGKSVGYRNDTTGEYVSGLTATVSAAPTYVVGKEVDGTVDKDATTKAALKGHVDVEIGDSVLPLTGTVQVKGGGNYNPTTATATGAKFVATPDTIQTPVQEAITEDIWVINGNTATYKRVQVATYKLDDDNNKVVCTPQKDLATFLTIKGLDEDALDKLINTSGKVTYSTKDTIHPLITGITGLTFSRTANAYYAADSKGKYAPIKVDGKTTPGTITIDGGLLGESNVTINTSDNYKLVISDSVAPTFKDQKWNLSGTTATLKGTIGKGWTVDDTGKKITYTAGGSNQTLATVKGLKSGTKLELVEVKVDGETTNVRTIGSKVNGTFTEGIKYNVDKDGATVSALSYGTADDGVGTKLSKIPITLSQNVLGTSGVTLTSTFYQIGINKATNAGKLLVKDSNDAANYIGWHGNLGATATLKQGREAYYTVAANGASITYTKPDTPATIATVKGLNKNITEDDIEFDTVAKTITLKNANAVAGSTITITNGKDASNENKPYEYKLALPTVAEGEEPIEGLTAPELDKRNWSQNGTTVTFKADVVAGYTVNGDNSAINYTKEGTQKTLATIKGVKADLVKTTAALGENPTDEEKAAYNAAQYNGITFNETTGTVTVSAEALNNATVSISGDGNYKLVPATGVPTAEAANVTNSWVISGGTATYKAIKAAYYDTTKANTLTYHAPTEDKWAETDKWTQDGEEVAITKIDKNLKGKSKVFATIKGLKSGLSVNPTNANEIGYYAYDATANNSEGGVEFVAAIKINDTTKEITIVDNAALDYKNNVTLDATTTKLGYTIGLSSDLAEEIRPGLKDEGTEEWKVSKGTATYVADLTEGYTNSSDGSSIKYQATKDKVTVATIKGLNPELTELTNNDVDGNVITISKGMLTTGDVTIETNVQIEDEPYKFVLDDDVTEYDDVKDNEYNGWVINGTTATYGTFVPTHYELNDGDADADDDDDAADGATTTSTTASGPSDKITYKPLGMDEEKKIATLTGLKSGLVTIKYDQISGITLGSLDGEGKFKADTDETETPGKVFQVSADVLADKTSLVLTTLDKEAKTPYTLAMDSDVDKPGPAESYSIDNNTADTSKVTIYYENTAGYTLETTDTNADGPKFSELKYNAKTKLADDVIAEMTGLKKPLTLNADGGIDGITVDHDDDAKTVTLSKSVLMQSSVTRTSGTYALKMGIDVPASESSGIGWKAVKNENNVVKGSFGLYTGMQTSGYSKTSDTLITYAGGNDGDNNGTLAATISGLNNSLSLTGTNLAGVEIGNDGKITISKSALGGNHVKLEPTGSNTYSLALNEDKTAEGYVAPPDETDAWSFDRSKGTATYTQTFIEGYELDDDGNIAYSKAKTITSTITGLNKASLTDTAGLNVWKDDDGLYHLIIGKATEAGTSTPDTTDDDGGDTETQTTYDYTEAITFDPDTNAFTIENAGALANKEIKLTVKSSAGNADAELIKEYAIGLDNDEAFETLEAKKETPIWVKGVNDTKATLTQTTGAGYYQLNTDNKTIKYSTDPTTITLATVTGLQKGEEFAAGTDPDKENYGKIKGLVVGSIDDEAKLKDFNESSADFEDGVTAEKVGNAIKISGTILNAGKVQLGTNDPYVFVLDDDDDTGVPVDKEPTEAWIVSGTTATRKNVVPAHYKYNSKTTTTDGVEKTTYNKKIIEYTGQTAGDTLLTITDLKKGLTAEQIKEGIDFDRNNLIKFDVSLLGTSDITVKDKDGKTDTYTLDFKDAVEYSEDMDPTTEWVGDGSTYTYKTYNKDSYSIDSTNHKIVYHAGTKGTTYATITGLKAGLIGGEDNAFTSAVTPADRDNPTAGGTIELDEAMLDGKNVKLTTSGNFKLKLAESLEKVAIKDSEGDDTGEEENWISEIKDTTWSTSNTTATLKGTIGKGYAISEDSKTVNYYNADKAGQTLATVSGIKKGAEIANTDVMKETVDSEDTGYNIITLNKAQLGTSKVTVKGDFYKIAAGSDAASGTEQAKWIKAKGSAKATYTEKTYQGFSATADGKTLNYNSKTTDVNLITLDGLNKDIAATAVDNPSAGESPTEIEGVTLDTDAKTITLGEAALTTSKVTVGKTDGYTLLLDNPDSYKSTPLQEHLVFDGKGTASVVKGYTESWEESTDGLAINYNKANEATLATVSGLSKNLEYTPDTNDPMNNKVAGFTLGDSVNSDGKIEITLDKDAFVDDSEKGTLVKKVTLANKPYKDPLQDGASGNVKYVLKLNDDVAMAGDTKGHKFSVSGTTAKYMETKSAGYDWSSTTKEGYELSYTAQKDGTVLTTITGLPKNLKASADLQKIVDKDGKEVAQINNSEVQFTPDFATRGLTAAATIKSDNYVLDNGNGVFSTNPVNTASTTIADKNVKNGTALVTATTHQGWKVSDDRKTATFTPEVDTTILTIKGINKNNTTQAGLALNNEDHIVTVGSAALTNSNVTGTVGNGQSVYNFALKDDVNSTLNSDTLENWKDITEWVVSGGTATYKTYDDENYYLKDAAKTGQSNSIVYVAPSKGYTYATISGLNKTATKENITPDGDGTITLGAAELGTAKVTLKVTKVADLKPGKNATNDEITAIETFNNDKLKAGNDTAAKFNLALDTNGGDNTVQASGVENAVWDTNGTTAKLTGTITKGYILSTDQKSISYQAADKDDQVIVTVNGIKKDAEILDSDVDPDPVNGVDVNTITLRAEQLGTSNITVKGEGYKLALDEDVIETADETEWQNQTEWVASSGTFTYKTYDKEHYELDEATNTIKYIKAADVKTNTNHKTYAVVSGLNKTAESSALAAPDATTGVITLGSDVLNKAKITLKDGDGGVNNYGYTLALQDTDKSTATVTAAALSGTKATWTATQGKGYLLANDAQSVSYYSKDTTRQTIATVTGLASGVTKAGLKEKFTSGTNTVALSGTDVGSNVTVGGTAAFSFDNTYDEGYITGSSSADKITVAGEKVSINAGAGNDYIDFAGGSNNTFVYASGQGNDVIANFGTSDNKIKINGVAFGNITIAASGSDALVTVNKKNTIRLKGLSDDVTALRSVIFDKDGKDLNGNAETANILADDNFETTPQLSSIVKAPASTYSAEDLVATDATSLTKKDSAVAYSGSSKK